MTSAHENVSNKFVCNDRYYHLIITINCCYYSRHFPYLWQLRRTFLEIYSKFYKKKKKKKLYIVVWIHEQNFQRVFTVL